jgi:uncharacterized protein YggT (Ycf19 family)
MSERIVESREAVRETNDGVVRERVVAADNPARPYARGERLVMWITGVVLSLLALRVVLSLLGANRNNAFAAFVYNLTAPFVAPFFGLFGYNMQYGVVRFEIETLVAMLVYALVGYGIARLLSLGRIR